MTTVTNRGIMPVTEAAHMLLKESSSGCSFLDREVENLLVAIMQTSASDGCNFEVSKNNIKAVSEYLDRLVAEETFPDLDALPKDSPAYPAWANFACSRNREDVVLHLKRHIDGMLA